MDWGINPAQIAGSPPTGFQAPPFPQQPFAQPQFPGFGGGWGVQSYIVVSLAEIEQQLERYRPRVIEHHYKTIVSFWKRFVAFANQKGRVREHITPAGTVNYLVIDDELLAEFFRRVKMGEFTRPVGRHRSSPNPLHQYKRFHTYIFKILAEIGKERKRRYGDYSVLAFVEDRKEDYKPQNLFSREEIARYTNKKAPLVTLDDLHKSFDLLREVVEGGFILSSAKKTTATAFVQLTLDFVLVATTGLREQTVRERLKAADIDLKERKIPDVVSAKTFHTRTVYLTKEAAELLKIYLGCREALVEHYKVRGRSSRTVEEMRKMLFPSTRFIEMVYKVRQGLREGGYSFPSAMGEFQLPATPQHFRKFFFQEWRRRGGDPEVGEILGGHTQVDSRHIVTAKHYVRADDPLRLGATINTDPVEYEFRRVFDDLRVLPEGFLKYYREVCESL